MLAIFPDQKDKSDEMVVLNTLPWKVRQVVAVEEGRQKGKTTQSAGEGKCYMSVEVAGIGWGKLSSLAPSPVRVCKY